MSGHFPPLSQVALLLSRSLRSPGRAVIRVVQVYQFSRTNFRKAQVDDPTVEQQLMAGIKQPIKNKENVQL